MRKASEAAQRRCFGRQCANTAHTSVSAARVPKASSRAVHWRCVCFCVCASTAPRPRCAWPTRRRVRVLCQARTSKRAARLGVARTHARRSSAQIVRSPISRAPRLQCPGIWSVRSGAHGGRASTTTALAAALRLVVTIRRTRHRHAVRRCPHRHQSCRQASRPACRPAAKNGAPLLLPAGIVSAKIILGRRRRRVPSASNAPQARVPQSRNHQRRYRGHGRPSPHMRHCLGHRHPHRSRQS